MKDEILANPDNPGQLEKLYRADNRLLSGHLKLCIPNTNTTCHAIDIGRKALKGHLDAPEQLILNNRKATNIFLSLYFVSQSAFKKRLKNHL